MTGLPCGTPWLGHAIAAGCDLRAPGVRCDVLCEGGAPAATYCVDGGWTDARYGVRDLAGEACELNDSRGAHEEQTRTNRKSFGRGFLKKLQFADQNMRKQEEFWARIFKNATLKVEKRLNTKTFGLRFPKIAHPNQVDLNTKTFER